MSTQLIHRNTSSAVSPYIDRGIDPYTEFASTLTQPGMDGEPLKFSKGRWLAGRGNDEYKADGKVLVADLENLMIGWRKWQDRRVTDQRVGLVAEGYKPPPRNSLGDLDDQHWERDTSGKAVDPWQLSFFLRLTDEESEAAFAWTATSGGARRAVGELVNLFARRRRKHPEACTPLIRLAADFYRHQSYGRVDVPKLELVEWRATDQGLPLPDRFGGPDPISTGRSADLDDSIPF
jgi:hypothetical protein